MFTGPICSILCRSVRQVSSSSASVLAVEPHNLRVARAAPALRRSPRPGSSPPDAPDRSAAWPRFARKRGAILAQLIQRRPRRFSAASQVRPVDCRSACACSASVLRQCQRFRTSLRSIPSAGFASVGVFLDALFALRLGRRALLFDRQHAPLQIRMTAGRCAGTLPPRRAAALRGPPAPRSSAPLPAAMPRASAAACPSCACCASRLLSACACSASSREASSRFCSIDVLLGLARVLVARRLRLSTPAAAARSRCASASICFSAAPRLAASLSACRRSSLRVSSCAVSSSMAPRERRRFLSACVSSDSSLRQPAFGLAQLALQRQRPFARRLAAGHRRVDGSTRPPA